VIWSSASNSTTCAWPKCTSGSKPNWGLRSIEHALWRAIRDAYAAGIAPLLDQEINKTYYNTLTRRFFKTRGVDAADRVRGARHRAHRPHRPIRWHATATPFGDLGGDTRSGACSRAIRFACRMRTSARCAQRDRATVEAQLGGWGSPPVRAGDAGDGVLSRARAYLVGRVFGEREHAPLVIALVHADGGIRADAVLTERDDVALFGTPAAISSPIWKPWAMPWCSCAPCCRRSRWTSSTPCSAAPSRARPSATGTSSATSAAPGRALRHADGERGMVMAVFTLPSIRWCSS
jgi:isocitrate dehydrogenase kinase/phosphatase